MNSKVVFVLALAALFGGVALITAIKNDAENKERYQNRIESIERQTEFKKLAIRREAAQELSRLRAEQRKLLQRQGGR